MTNNTMISKTRMNKKSTPTMMMMQLNNILQVPLSNSGFPAHESFDVSSFTESKSGPDMLSRHIKGSFPVSNAPTLEVSPDLKLKFETKNNHRKFKLDDYKIPNDISEASKMSSLEEELQLLRK
jgi:hypothetical protein